MSVEFTVICTRALPADWPPNFRAEGLPFDFWLESFSGWRAAEGDELDAEIADRLAVTAGSFVAQFRCRPQDVELVDRCAQALTSRFGGFFIDDHSQLLSHSCEGSEEGTGAATIAEWSILRQDRDARQRQSHELAMKEWLAAAASDPAAYAEANDWSDLL